MNLDLALLEEEIGRITGENVSILSCQELTGGDINRVYSIETNQGAKCIKLNSAIDFPGMFEAEMKGLLELSRKNTIDVAIPLACGSIEETSFLFLEYIHSGQQQSTFWIDFGRKLAKMHRATAPFFGLEHNNYIGSLQQSNEHQSSWADFFITCRLEPQIKLANAQGLLDRKDLDYFNRFYKKIPELFPKENPSLLHGDLWQGNFMVGPNGQPVLIDPAVYYGHREMDVSMTLLFGGFPGSFYESYNEQWPLEAGWRDRVDYCNLYPLLVHLNLFGNSYLPAIRRIIKKF